MPCNSCLFSLSSCSTHVTDYESSFISCCTACGIIIIVDWMAHAGSRVSTHIIQDNGQILPCSISAHYPANWLQKHTTSCDTCSRCRECDYLQYVYWRTPVTHRCRFTSYPPQLLYTQRRSQALHSGMRGWRRIWEDVRIVLPTVRQSWNIARNVYFEYNIEMCVCILLHLSRLEINLPVPVSQYVQYIGCDVHYHARVIPFFSLVLCIFYGWPRQVWV